MRRRQKLPVEAWPEADLALWSRLTRVGGPLDDVGTLSHLRATTLRTIATGYGRWLAHLTVAAPASLATPPAARVTVARLSAWTASLDRLTPSSRLMLVDAALRVATAADPERNWSAERRLRALLAHEAGCQHGARKHGRILSSAVLFEAGRDLAAAPVEGKAHARALRMQDGTMIAFLALMPLRLRAFAALRLGRSLLVEPTRMLVSLDAEMTKTGAPWSAPIPAPLEPILRRWLDQGRPLLLHQGDGEEDHLWISANGCRFSEGRISVRVAKATCAALGVPIPPHFFRDAAATTLARTSPDAARLTRALLGHSSYRTAERHYNHARGIEAGRDYAAVLDRLMGEEDEE